MKSEKLVAGIAIGVIVALILIPKSRRMLSDALGSITDSLKNIAGDAGELVEKGSNQLSNLAEKATNVAGSVKETKQAWQ